MAEDPVCTLSHHAPEFTHGSSPKDLYHASNVKTSYHRHEPLNGSKVKRERERRTDGIVMKRYAHDENDHNVRGIPGGSMRNLDCMALKFQDFIQFIVIRIGGVHRRMSQSHDVDG